MVEPKLIAARLADVTNVIARSICNISGVAGMSVGVVHHGEVIYTDNLGTRHVNRDEPSWVPTSKTIYNIGSISKSFAAAAIGRLFHDSDHVDWYTPVEEILQDFQPADKRLRGLLATSDFMSHRSGLFGDLSLALQGDFEFLLPRQELVRTVGQLETIAPFRQSWHYNNWGYSVVGEIIEELSGRDFGDYLDETVIGPLNLSDTTSRPNFGDAHDFADAHFSLRDGTCYPAPRRYYFKDSLFEAAAGIYSNVDEMLQWGLAILRAESNPDTSPLRHMQISTLVSNQIPLDNPSHDFRFYGMGWIRTQLPGVVGLQGDNPELLELHELPVLGAGGPSMLTYYHQSSAPGYYSAIFLFPETESVVVVMTNSMPLNDAADWIIQAYISALFNFPTTADYVELAERSGKSKLQKSDEVLKRMREIRDNHPHDKPLPASTYVGTYVNSIKNFHIEILEGPTGPGHPQDTRHLEMRFQGRESQRYQLRHLYGQVYEWAVDFDEAAKRGRAVIWDPEYFLVHFTLGADGSRANALSWAAFTDVRPGGIIMHRDDDREGNGRVVEESSFSIGGMLRNVCCSLLGRFVGEL
ncbi:beta-lactamase/transpeptidase-like protein [Echria macrotheca]|uniref:Beta-lactamase/transpeptidase-like protein n=1 Tax=Echria macrotheca TaxID=438768 RepID=A0AAJ0B3H2_9PEZI|nr:beta-lactamase/transpeptidase-like protein [Echria macrotheca]